MIRNGEHGDEQSEKDGVESKAVGSLHTTDDWESTTTGEDTVTPSSSTDYEKSIRIIAAQNYKVLSEKIQKQFSDGFLKYKEYTINKTKEFQKQIDETRQSSDDVKGEFKEEVNELKKELEDKIENSKLTIIETLGIFIALFTFISIDFQVFRSYRTPQAISGLLLIFFGAIFLFIIIFDFFILQARRIKEQNNLSKSKQQKDIQDSFKDRIKKQLLNHWYRVALLMLSVLFTIGGTLLFVRSPIEDLQDKKQEIKDEVYRSIKNSMNNQNGELLKINESNQKAIDNLKINLDNIKNCVIDFGFTYRCFR